MKCFRAWLLLLALSLAFTSASSQSICSGIIGPAVELRDEPHHHLRFENGYVRVWETYILGGDATLWHKHDNDNVAITLDDAEVCVEAVGGVTRKLFKRGEFTLNKAPYVHRTSSVGKMPFHNLAVEILKSPHDTSRNSGLKAQTGGEPAFGKGVVRIYPVTLAPGESTGMFRHTLPVLWVAISPGEVEVRRKGSRPGRVKTSAGGVRWLGGPATYSIQNVGGAVFEGLAIELKSKSLPGRRGASKLATRNFFGARMSHLNSHEGGQLR